MKHVDPRTYALELEQRASLPDVPERERLRGYAVTGLPFRSGHMLAMRRIPASSIGPAYTSIWHRDDRGRLVIYQDQEPQFSCPRVFGPAVDEAPVVPIRITWTDANRFSMAIATDSIQLHWDIRLDQTTATRIVNAAVAAVPQSWWHKDAFLAAAGRVAGPLLGVGRVRLKGTTPSGQDFSADLHRVWVIEESTAIINGVDLGQPGPLPSQPHLSDFWLPQRGLFAFVDGFFEPYDPSRHDQVATRAELEHRPQV